MSEYAMNPFDHLAPYDGPYPKVAMPHPFNRHPIFSTMGRGPRGEKGDVGFIEFADPLEHDKNRSYKSGVIVLGSDGASYLSKQDVPAGIELSDERYWGITATPSAQVEAYRREVLGFEDALYKRAIVFETVADMKPNELTDGNICHTNGFHKSGDGGAAWYEISNTLPQGMTEANGMDVIGIPENAPVLYANLVNVGELVTPEMYGAYGDGIHDDAPVLKYMIGKNLPIYIENIYKIDSPIVEDAAAHSIYLNLHGNTAHDVWYDLDNQKSYILVSDGVSVFKNSFIYGNIDGVGFIGEGANGQTSLTQEMLFDTCGIYSLNFGNCFVYNFEAVFLNSGIYSNSDIHNNKFLSCYYFAKRTTDAFYGIDDSRLFGNYINGGSKYNDNACFQWQSYARSVIESNFIDFYRSIYDISANGLDHGRYPACIYSMNNRYDVFRYFILNPQVMVDGQRIPAVPKLTAVFSNDQFTHVDVGVATQFNLSRYTPITVYSSSNTPYQIKPYLMMLYSNIEKEFNVVFENVNFHTDAFTEQAPFNSTAQSPFSAHALAKLKFDYAHRGNAVIPNLIESQNTPVEGAITYYGNNDHFIETNYIKVLSEEPSFGSDTYNQVYIPGCWYVYDNVLYKCIKYKSGSVFRIGLINNQGELTYHQ